jgi:hypothetical protein
VDKNLEQRQAKWCNINQANDRRMYVLSDNRSCMRDIRSEINYCLVSRPLVVSLTTWLIYRRANGVTVIEFG